MSSSLHCSRCSHLLWKYLKPSVGTNKASSCPHLLLVTLPLLSYFQLFPCQELCIECKPLGELCVRVFCCGEPHCLAQHIPDTHHQGMNVCLYRRSPSSAPWWDTSLVVSSRRMVQAAVGGGGSGQFWDSVHGAAGGVIHPSSPHAPSRFPSLSLQSILVMLSYPLPLLSPKSQPGGPNSTRARLCDSILLFHFFLPLKSFQCFSCSSLPRAGSHLALGTMSRSHPSFFSPSPALTKMSRAPRPMGMYRIVILLS